MANKGYNNKDCQLVRVSSDEKRGVRRMARRALKRIDNGEHPRSQANRATRRGWWYA